MPRRLTDCRFGESACSSIVRMSNEAMWQTKMKNEHERWRFLKELRQLLSDEKVARSHTRRELEMLRDEYTRMLAYSSVCKEHGFEKYDPFLTGHLKCLADNQPMGVSRQTSLASTKLPDINENPNYIRVYTSSKRRDSERSDTKREDTVFSRRRFSSIADSENSDFTPLFDNDDVLESKMEPVPEETGNSEEEEKVSLALSSILAMKLQALVMWKQKLHNNSNRVDSERPKFVRKKVISDAPAPALNQPRPTRSHTLFPGDSKTVYSMKRFLEREVSNKMVVLATPKKDKAKFDRMIERARLPELIERRKTTSAIFRDFRTYKESLHGRKIEDNKDKTVLTDIISPNHVD